jgi:gamma-glutamyl-gamma-aminobutyrate hydrolase PuuD
MATSTRIYIVNGPTGSRLVKASVASQAITHVAKSEFSAKVASQDDLVEALSNGIKVEVYGESAQGELDVE